MCQIIYMPPFTELSMTDLSEQYNYNPDGWGYIETSATAPPFVEKGFKFWELARLVEESDPSAHRLIHLRYATHGAVSIENNHPFFLTEHPSAGPLWMMHNGIIHKYSNDRNSSDSRRFADEYLAPLLKESPKLWKRKTTRALEMAIQDVDPISRFIIADGQGGVVIINRKAWECVDGVWFSAPHTLRRTFVEDTYDYYFEDEDNDLPPYSFELEDGFYNQGRQSASKLKARN